MKNADRAKLLSRLVAVTTVLSDREIQNLYVAVRARAAFLLEGEPTPEPEPTPERPELMLPPVPGATN